LDKGVEAASYDKERIPLVRRSGLHGRGSRARGDAVAEVPPFALRRGIGEEIFEDAKRRMERGGLMRLNDSVEDAMIVSALASTKTSQGKSDEEIHSVQI